MPLDLGRNWDAFVVGVSSLNEWEKLDWKCFVFDLGQGLGLCNV